MINFWTGPWESAAGTAHYSIRQIVYGNRERRLGSCLHFEVK